MTIRTLARLFPFRIVRRPRPFMAAATAEAIWMDGYLFRDRQLAGTAPRS